MRSGYFEKLSSAKRNAIIAISLAVLALFLEVFVFNYRYWQSRGYEPVEIPVATQDESVNQIAENRYTFLDSSGALYFGYFDETEIKNIYVDVENVTDYDTDSSDDDARKFAEAQEEKAASVTIELIVPDEANKYGLTMPDRVIVSTVERTKYIALHTAGGTDCLRMVFPNSAGNTVQVNCVILNAKVPMFFSVTRFLIVLAVLMLCRLLRPRSSVYQVMLDVRRPAQLVLIAAVIVLQSVFSMGMTSVTTSYVNATSENAADFSLAYQKRYILLSDAILSGRVDVDYDPGVDISEMESLDNPYDPVQLTAIGSMWNDYAYFQGKYYVYFGVVPCLLFNIPIKLLTGKDVMPYPCIMALLPLVVTAAFALVYALIRRFCMGESRSFPLAVYLLLSVIFVNSLSLCYLYTTPDAYFLPILTALFFVLLGLYLWITAVKTEGAVHTLSGWRLCFGSLCMALTGGCRPQFLIGMFLAIPLFWDTVVKERLLLSVKTRKAARDTILFCLPVVAVALGLFWYNYIRFGSIFDFGANYNQTNNDMTSRGFEPYRAVQGIFYYILQMPNMQEKFPYLVHAAQNPSYMGTNIMLETYGGILWLQPVIWSMLLLKPLRMELREKKMRLLLGMLLAFTLIVVCVDSMMAGIVDRYQMDFCWMTAMASVLVLALGYLKYTGSSHGDTLIRCLTVMPILMIVLSVILCITNWDGLVAQTNPSFYYGLQSLVEFWY